MTEHDVWVSPIFHRIEDFSERWKCPEIARTGSEPCRAGAHSVAAFTAWSDRGDRIEVSCNEGHITFIECVGGHFRIRRLTATGFETFDKPGSLARPKLDPKPDPKRTHSLDELTTRVLDEDIHKAYVIEVSQLEKEPGSWHGAALVALMIQQNRDLAPTIEVKQEEV
jgi:hypothetical protein